METKRDVKYGYLKFGMVILVIRNFQYSHPSYSCLDRTVIFQNIVFTYYSKGHSCVTVNVADYQHFYEPIWSANNITRIKVNCHMYTLLNQTLKAKLRESAIYNMPYFSIFFLVKVVDSSCPVRLN